MKFPCLTLFLSILPWFSGSLPGTSLMAHTMNGTHLLQNGNFSHWEKAAPVGWNLGSGAAFEPDTTMTYEGLQSLRAVIDKGKKKAEIYQDIELEPDCEYLLDFSMAKHGTGSVAVRVQPIEGGKRVPGSSAPLAWSNVWSWQFPWSSQRLRFTTGRHAAHRLTILNHGKPGEPFWIENITLRKASPPHRENAVALYTQSIMRPFDESGWPETARPLGQEEPLVANATRGDFSARFVGLRAGAPLRQVDLKLRGELVHAESGAKIRAQRVAIRMVAEQALLPLSRPRDLAASRQLGWWVTAHIPENAAPGLYHGTLELLQEGRPIATFPYLLRVEAFTLPRPGIPFFVYHAEVYLPKGMLNRETRLAYYRDMKHHGMNSVTVYGNPDVDGETIDLDQDYRYAAQSAQQREAMLKRNDWSEQELESRNAFGLRQTMELLHESGLVSPGQVVPWLPLKAGAYSFGDMPSVALRRTLEEWARHKEWPTPLLYVHDEPYGQPERIAAATRALERLKSLDLPVRTTTANLPVKELGEAYDVWIQGARRVTPEMAHQAAAMDRELWAYNCNMPTDNAPFTRAYFGFWAYRSKVRGVGLWAYYDAKTWFIDGEGKVHGKNGVANLSRICPSPDGPVPTISWETTREGVNDYRYAMLFDQSLAQLEMRRDRLEAAWSEGLDPAQAEALRHPSATQRTAALKHLPAEKQTHYAAYREMNEMVALGERIREKIIGSVPFDAFAPMGEIAWSAENGNFLPVIGYGDPQVSAEYKRRVLRSYLRFFQAALAR